MNTGEIDKVFAGLDTKLIKFKTEFASEVMKRVTARTPVGKTGKLKNGWGYTMHQKDVEFWNVKEYSRFVEYGTPRMAPRAMLRTTLMEADDIAKVAAQKAGIK